MSDLTSKKLIVAKGLMFLFIAVISAGLVLIQLPSWNIAALLVLLVWSSCRFYYFLFYVLEKYVNPSYRYAGLWALIQAVVRQRR